jgi:hypothetical protein
MPRPVFVGSLFSSGDDPMLYPSLKRSFAFPGDASPRGPSSVHQHAADLIGRYPALSKPELDRLVGLFPRLSALDMSLIMADARLNPRLEAFCTTHRYLLRPSLADMAVIGAILSLPILILATLIVAGP